MNPIFLIAILTLTALNVLGQRDTIREFDTAGNLVSEKPTENGVVHGICKYWTSDGKLWVVSEVDQGTTKKETTYSESGVSLITTYSKNTTKKTGYFRDGKKEWTKEWRKDEISMTEWDSLGNIKSTYFLKNACEIACFAGMIDDSIVFVSCYCDDVEVFEKDGIYVDSNNVPINQKAVHKETEYYPNGKKKSMLLEKGQVIIYSRKWNEEGLLVEEEN